MKKSNQTIKPNRLALETSPYLLQHAHNPVDWYAWGEEAMAKAAREQKPIFLSIGYSACHWCHVMEKESFEDQETADLLKKHFIAVKVDREERPDIDSIYMNAVQMITGKGGWPLSVFLTPELKPFYGGTYFPSSDKYGMPTFKTVLTKVASVWEDRRNDVEASAEEMTTALRSIGSRTDNPSQIGPETISSAAKELSRSFDAVWGGFGSAPKFPPSPALSLLMRQFSKTGDRETMDMVTLTLDRMSRGGMYDQVGGGFHRYSVDDKWLVPHFEKMLYDNAILADVYLDAYQLTANVHYRQTATEILDYVIRDMTGKSGGIYSSQDADSEGEEGKYYVWTARELEQILGGTEAALACRYFSITPAGNFEGSNIPNIPVPPAEFAATEGISRETLEHKVNSWRSRLLAARTQRAPPATDTKVISAWNGMMISALAHGCKVLGEERFKIAAENAARFVLESMMEKDELARSHAGGRKGASAYLEDYAEMVRGLITLYEATFAPKWLDSAGMLATRMLELFSDPSGPGFFFTSNRHSHLLVRTKEFADSSTPSGNATAALVLLKLGRLTGNKDYISRAEKALTAASHDTSRTPLGFISTILAADLAASPSREIVIIGHREAGDTSEMLSLVRRLYLPDATVVLADPAARSYPAMAGRIPLLKGKTMLNGKATAYVCEDFTCRPPVSSADELRTILAR